MQFSKLLVGAVVALAAWNPFPAAASSCTGPLGTFNHWFLTQPNGRGNYALVSLLASNDNSRGYVSYGESSNDNPFSLVYHAAVPSRGPKLPGYPAYVSEQFPVVQYFSNRRYKVDPNSQFSYPFDPAQTDSLGVQIVLQDWPALNILAGQTTFILYTWGNSKYTMSGTCQNGLLFGFLGNAIETLSLNEFFSPTPPARHRIAPQPTARRGHSS